MRCVILLHVVHKENSYLCIFSCSLHRIAQCTYNLNSQRSHVSFPKSEETAARRHFLCNYMKTQQLFPSFPKCGNHECPGWNRTLKKKSNNSTVEKTIENHLLFYTLYINL